MCSASLEYVDAHRPNSPSLALDFSALALGPQTRVGRFIVDFITKG